MFSVISTFQIGLQKIIQRQKYRESAVAFEVDDRAAVVVAIISLNWRNGRREPYQPLSQVQSWPKILGVN